MHVVEHQRQVTDAHVGTNRPSVLQRQKERLGGGTRELMDLRHVRQELVGSQKHLREEDADKAVVRCLHRKLQPDELGECVGQGPIDRVEIA
jgi:hypothetical protein